MGSSRAQTPHSDAWEEEIPVYLKLVKTVTCKVKPTETVENLKALLYEKGIVSENIRNVSFANQLLEDGERLVDYGIQRYSSVHLFLQNSDRVKLFVTIPSMQKTVMVEARDNDTVQRIKSLIQEKEGIESDRFSLVYKGNLVEEERTLRSLNVENESTLCLVFSQENVMSIYVKVLTGEVVKLKVKGTFSVGEVKAIAASMFGVSAGNLFYSGQHLEDAKILFFYDIKEESMLELLHPVFQIFVKSWSGKTIILDVQQNTTVKGLKDKIFQKLKVPVNCQKIIFAGKLLVEGRDLAHYGIEKNCTVNMVLYAPSAAIKLMNLGAVGCLTSPSTTVRSLKQMIKLKIGIQVKELIYQDVLLQDEFSLGYYRINHDSLLKIFY